MPPSKRPLSGKSLKPKKAINFKPKVSRMMHAFGDGPEPLAECVALVEEHALRSARAILAAVRQVAGRNSLFVRDFAKHMPISTHVYFRWRKMKTMTKDGMKPKVGGSGGGSSSSEAPGGSGRKKAKVQGGEGGEEGFDGEEGNGDDDEDDDEDEEEEEGEEEDGEEEEEEEGLGEGEGGVDDDELGGELPPVMEGLEGGGGEEEPEEMAAAFQQEEDGEEAEDAEEAEQVSLLEAAVDEELRTGLMHAAAAAAAALDSSSAPASVAATLITPPTLQLSTPLANFIARLAFANARSIRMSSSQYECYVKAREAGFVTKHGSKAFRAILPPASKFSRIVLEILSFLAYERVNTVVEAAAAKVVGVQQQGGGEGEGEGEMAGSSSSASSSSSSSSSATAASSGAGDVLGGKTTSEVLMSLLPPSGDGPVGDAPPLPLYAYKSALAAVPLLPQELQVALAQAQKDAERVALGDVLRQAREEGKAKGAEDRAHSEAVAAKWGPGKLDAKGDAFFLAGLNSATQAAAAAPPVTFVRLAGLGTGGGLSGLARGKLGGGGRK